MKTEEGGRSGPFVFTKNNGSVLLAEDSVLYRRLIEFHLQEWGFDVSYARDGEEAWELLMRSDAPRLALLDWVLPEIDGIELCRRLRNRSENEPYTYAILLTSKNRRNEMLEAMDAGADEFLAKPFDPLELKARILVGQRIVELQQKLVSANSTLHFAASHDFLTGVWNRAAIFDFMKRELARSERDGSSVGIILVDVDHFKNVNDNYGHGAGDSVLQEITRRLSATLREYDGIGRYGGEEFLLVMPGCNLSSVGRRADQIRELICSKPVVTPSQSMNITVSMGVVATEPSSSLEMLLRHADAALYQAKRSGRNQIQPAASFSVKEPVFGASALSI